MLKDQLESCLEGNLNEKLDIEKLNDMKEIIDFIDSRIERDSKIIDKILRYFKKASFDRVYSFLTYNRDTVDEATMISILTRPNFQKIIKTSVKYDLFSFKSDARKLVALSNEMLERDKPYHQVRSLLNIIIYDQDVMRTQIAMKKIMDVYKKASQKERAKIASKIKTLNELKVLLLLYFSKNFKNFQNEYIELWNLVNKKYKKPGNMLSKLIFEMIGYRSVKDVLLNGADDKLIFQKDLIEELKHNNIFKIFYFMSQIVLMGTTYGKIETIENVDDKILNKMKLEVYIELSKIEDIKKYFNKCITADEVDEQLENIEAKNINLHNKEYMITYYLPLYKYCLRNA